MTVFVHVSDEEGPRTLMEDIAKQVKANKTGVGEVAVSTPHPVLLSFIPSLIHSFSHSFLLSFIPSLIESLSHSFLLSLIPPLIHSFSRSFISSLILALIHLCIESCSHEFIPSLIPSFLLSFIPFFSSRQQGWWSLSFSPFFSLLCDCFVLRAYQRFRMERYPRRGV